jgi:soluble lytic murein transglycosylase-like protein
MIGFAIGKRGVFFEYVYVRSEPAYEIDIDDPDLVESIIEVESRGDPKAISKCGAIGLMQVNWPVWKSELLKKGITREDLFHPKKNRIAGVYILKKHYRWAKGDMRKTLQGYSGDARLYYERVVAAYFTRKIKNGR